MKYVDEWLPGIRIEMKEVNISKENFVNVAKLRLVNEGYDCLKFERSGNMP